MTFWTYTAFTLDGQSCGHNHYSVDAADRCAHRMAAKLKFEQPVYIMARGDLERRDGPVCLYARESTEHEKMERRLGRRLPPDRTRAPRHVRRLLSGTHGEWGDE